MIRGQSPPASGMDPSFKRGLEFDDGTAAATGASEHVHAASGTGCVGSYIACPAEKGHFLP